ncbi:spore coat protein U domain-containing protein [Sphingomonas sp. PR090111-T3T-6A]|uniref:spore coat protein U domain-containing protein n=1 Tax=Sphingomonas sp. PR090111-T3T-6A TaxID=685778 RepID=UPI0012F9D900|nr:spore coat protein U domain-containing protein [Sphingomonas sp. PR090111-T3T-6A]
MTLARLLLAMMLAVLLPGAAEAASYCTVSSPAFTFQPSSSYDVQAQAIPAIGGQAGLTCNASSISLLGTNYANATMTSANGFKLMAGPGGDAIPFSVSADQAGTIPFTQGGTVNYTSSSLLSLGILTGGTFTPMTYMKLAAGPNVAAGTYTDTLTVAWSWNICIVAVVVCVTSDTGTGTSTIVVTLKVNPDCKITANDVSLGSAPLASQFSMATRAVLTDCTKGSIYQVSFTAGGNNSARPWRAMSDTGGHSLQYNIYLPDGVTIWDQSNPQTNQANGGKGTGLVSPAQQQTYRIGVNPAQTTPPAGHYTDTVSVVLSF